MDESLKHEVLFLVAKLLKTEFPDIGDLFIQECEARKMFPSLVFHDHPSFDQLKNVLVTNISDEQLSELIHRSQSLSNPSLATCLSSHLYPKVSPMHNISPQIRIIGHKKSVYCLAFDITSQLLITGSDDSCIKVWNYSENTLMKSLQIHSSYITDIQVHQSNEFFVACSLDFSVSIISLHDFSVINVINLESEVYVIRFSPDGKYMAAALEKGVVKILEVPTWKEYYTISSPHKQAVAWLSFSPGSEFLIFSSDPNNVTIFSMRSFKVDEICNEHDKLPEYVSFSRYSCQQFISCSYKENCVKLWEFDSKTAKWAVTPKGNLTFRDYENKKNTIVRVSYNCDESNIVAISKRGIICWNSRTKDLINTTKLEKFIDHCTALAMHPTLPNVAFVGSASGCGLIWDTNLGEVISLLQIDDEFTTTDAIWSNNGLSVVASDNMGGFTKFTYNKQPFITSEQFFLSDFTDQTEDSSIVTNSLSQPLIPQPTISKIADFRLSIKQPKVMEEAVDEEEAISKRWMSPLFRMRTSASFIDEEDDDIINSSQRISEIIPPSPIDKPITSSRMSTRHSISIYDENLNLDLDSDSAPAVGFHNTRSREKRMKEMIKKRERMSNYDESSLSDEEPVRHYSPVNNRQKRRNTREKKKENEAKIDDEYEYVYEEEDENSNDESETSSETDNGEGNSNQEEEEIYGYEYESQYEYESEFENNSDDSESVVTSSGRKSKETMSFSPEPQMKRPKRNVSKRTRRDESPSSSQKTVKKTSKMPTRSKVTVFSPPATRKRKSPSKATKNVESTNHMPKRSAPQKLTESPTTTITGRKTTVHRSFSPDPPVVRKKSSASQSPSRSVNASAVNQKKARKEPIVIENPEKPNIQEMPKSVPEFITFTTPHRNTFVPQVGDSVAYIQKAHQMYFDECCCDQYLPPFLMMDDFPPVVFGTVKDVKYFVAGLLVKLDINEPKKVKKAVPQTYVYIPYPLCPPVLVERSNYDEAMSKSRSLANGQKIEVMENDMQDLMGCLVDMDDDWSTSPFQSLTVQLDKNKKKIRVSPWEVLFFMKRPSHSPTQKLCAQITPFLNNLYQNDDYDIFKDWTLCDKEKYFVDKMMRPVDLTIFLKRVKNNFYRTTDEIVDDVKRLDKTLLTISQKRKKEIQVIIESLNEVIQNAIERLHIQLIDRE